MGFLIDTLNSDETPFCSSFQPFCPVLRDELGFFNEIPNLVYGQGSSHQSLVSNIKTASINRDQSGKLLTDRDLYVPQSLDELQCNTNTHQRLFQFFIPERIPGVYKIEQRGRNDQANSSISDGEKEITTNLNKCETDTVIVSTYEPSSWLSLMFFTIFGSLFIKTKTKPRLN